MSVPATVITCSGISSTGQLTAKAAMNLRRSRPALVEEHIPATSPAEKLGQALRDADCILVIDGCEDCCGVKKVRSAGFEPDFHVVATAYDIVKRGMEEPRFDEIDLICMVIRKVLER